MTRKIIVLLLIVALGIGALFLFVEQNQQEQQNNGKQTTAISNTTQESIDRSPLLLQPQTIVLKNGKSFTLSVAQGFKVIPAFEGLKRVRFMANSPDKRLFVTDMYDLTDNRKGKVYILGGLESTSKKFKKTTTYLSNLRNPNNIAFYTKDDQTWIYIGFTDKLVRYLYHAGDTSPSGPAETLATFPSYGLSYKYGGWHLTRTVAFHNDKLYVSVGSSCNSCEEKENEPMRATILEMNPDGSESHVYANGLRNAVGIKWIKNDFFATAMGADHLGNDAPQDTFQVIKSNTNYGWPYCYEQDSRIHEDNSQTWQRKKIDCADVPLSYAPLGAHSAPLGFDYFGNATDPALHNYFLVALHGSGNPAIGRGYAVARIQHDMPPETLIGGFLQNGIRYGRPADVLMDSDNSFFFTDDFGGVIYYVYK